MRKEDAAKCTTWTLDRESRVEGEDLSRRRGRCKVLEHKSGPMQDELKGGSCYVVRRFARVRSAITVDLMSSKSKISARSAGCPTLMDRFRTHWRRPVACITNIGPWPGTGK